MDLPNIASLFVAIIAALSAYASQRSAAKASVVNVGTTSRVEMEKEAYERARALDTETIRRIEVENDELRSLVTRLRKEILTLKRRIKRLERGVPNSLEGDINERNEEFDSSIE